MNMTNGILMTAMGPRYVREAMFAAKSFKRFNPGLPIAVFTDAPGHVNKNLAIPYPMEWKGRKDRSKVMQALTTRLEVWGRTPFERTFAFDTDVFCCADIREVFRLLDRFDVVMNHGHCRVYRLELAKNEGIDQDLPEPFTTVQGGSILFRKTPDVMKVIKALPEAYVAQDYFDDQLTIRRALWESNLQLYFLPPEWNFNHESAFRNWREKSKVARPRIFHYTTAKGSKVRKIMNREGLLPFPEGLGNAQTNPNQ